MGGAVEVPGNVTPVAEFNTFADAVATARVFALTSPTPSSTMPPVPAAKRTLPPYPETPLSRRLNLSLFPLDITTPHQLRPSFFINGVKPTLDAGSPLAQWVNTFMGGIFRQIITMVGDHDEESGLEEEGLSLHDPLTIWYMLTSEQPEWKLAANAPEDIRVETTGQWTHGMHVADRRGRVRADGKIREEILGDEQGWLSTKRGNRINRYVSSPGYDAFAPYLMERLFG